MEYKERIKEFAAYVCRFLLGIVFLFSGTVKAIDPAGGAIKVGEYFTAFGLDNLQWLAVPFFINLGGGEVTLGAFLVLGA